jgi:hypothetical protein
MRCFTFIMAILVLSLSCMPCGDAQKVMVKKATRELAQAPHTQEHEDYCSPFCHCACCAGFSINHQVAVLSQPWSPFAALHASRYIESIREVSIPVWQPPQLS